MNKAKAAALTACLPLSARLWHGSAKKYAHIIRPSCKSTFAGLCPGTVAEEHTEIVRFTYPTNMSSLLYANALLLRTRRRPRCTMSTARRECLWKAYSPREGIEIFFCGAIITVSHYIKGHTKPRP